MTINKTLWPHQKKGVDFAQERNAAMLAMGMRSGKTLTTLQLIETVNAQLVLIVAGKHPVQYVWQKQIADHTDWNDHAQIIDLTVGSIPKRTEKLQARTDALLTVVLINYEVTHREPLYAALRAIAWDIVVVDESHRIAGHGSKTSKALHRIGKNAARRVCLTGTPYPENPLKIYGQARFLDDTLYTVPKNKYQTSTAWTYFRKYYAYLEPLPYQRGVQIVTGYKNLDDLHARIAPLLYHVRTEDVVDVPDSQIVDITFNLPPKIKKQYREFKREYIVADMTASNVLVKSLRLAQMANGWIKPDGQLIQQLHSAKMQHVESLVSELGGKPAVIFCIFTHEIAAIRQMLSTMGISNGELSGNENTYDAWDHGKTQILVCQYASGAEAYDMSRAGITIYFSPTYKLTEYEQSLARTKMHKGGLVTYYRLIALDTIDEIIYDVLDHKKDIITELMK